MRQAFIVVFGAILLASHAVVAQAPAPGAPGSHTDSGPPNFGQPPGHRVSRDAAQIRHAMQHQLNDGLVGIVSGSMDATDLGKTTDLVVGLGTGRDRLRPVLTIGQGAFQNVNDILFARGIDIGIVQSDVLVTLKHDPPFPGVENYIRYITKLYDEEVHILTGKDIGSVQDLADKKVNFGMLGTGTHTTGETIFRVLDIPVDATSFPQPVALEKLRKGEISALVCVVSRPDRWFRAVGPDENLHFLSIPATDELRKRYTPANLRAEDYPALIDPDTQVATLAVGNVLVAYNWPERTERYRRVALFARTFFDRLHDLQSPPFHPKWREVDVAAPVPGWTRFADAQAWIRKAGLNSTSSIRYTQANDTVAPQEPATLSRAERTALFTEFAAYRERLASPLNSAGLFDARQRDALFLEFVAYQKRQAYSPRSIGGRDAPQRDALFAASAN
jgi:TRAP-type uncharacterized transport system substrate-binding protein